MSQEQAKQFLEQATQSLQSGQFDQALELVDQSIELNPSDTEAFVLRGIALSQTGRPQEATESFRKAILLSPYNAKAYFNLAVHQYAQGHKVEALEMVREAARVDPRHTGARDLLRQIEDELSAHVSAVPERESRPDDPLFAAPPPAGETPPPPGTEAPAPPPAQPPMAQPPMAQPPRPVQMAAPDFRQGYEQTAHSLPFVQNLGGGWVAAGWVISVLSFVVFVVSLAVIVPMVQKVMENPRAGEQMGMFGGPPALQIASWGVLLLGILWTVLDLVDRRGNWVWLIPMVLCSCCGMGWLILPIYLLAGRN